MALVRLAEDLKHGRKVAIKVMKPELAVALGADRFLREIETVAQLNHPYLARVQARLSATQAGAGRPH